jgi:hypothetical protein
MSDDTTMFDENDDPMNDDLLRRILKVQHASRTASWFVEHEPLMVLVRHLQKELARAVEEINVNRRAIKELRRQQP